MMEEINIKLTAAEAIEVVAFITEMLKEIKEGAPIQFLQETAAKIKDQILSQCTSDLIDQAIHEINVQTLLNKAP